MLQEPIQRERPWAGHCDPHRQDDVGPLLEPEKIRDAVQGVALGGENRDGHDHDQRERGQAAQQAHQQQSSADELGRRRQDRVEARSRNAELREEPGYLVEAVQLSPAGAEEDHAERESRERGPQKGEAVSDGEESGLRARNDAHGFAPRKFRRRPLSVQEVNPWRSIRRIQARGYAQAAIQPSPSQLCSVSAARPGSSSAPQTSPKSAPCKASRTARASPVSTSTWNTSNPARQTTMRVDCASAARALPSQSGSIW